MERVNSHVHLPVSAACALYDAPEDGCVLHLKHVEQKCNKITLNNLHQAGPNKPIHKYQVIDLSLYLLTFLKYLSSLFPMG